MNPPAAMIPVHGRDGLCGHLAADAWRAGRRTSEVYFFLVAVVAGVADGVPLADGVADSVDVAISGRQTGPSTGMLVGSVSSISNFVGRITSTT